MPAPLLTIFGRAIIALIPRLFVYIVAMFAGAGAAVATEKVIELKKRDEKEHVDKLRKDARARALSDLR